MPELQRALATLAFKSSTNVAAYKVLFQEQQWIALLELFHKELYRLHCLLPESQLTVHLQVRKAADESVFRLPSEPLALMPSWLRLMKLCPPSQHPICLWVGLGCFLLLSMPIRGVALTVW
jgi:hypothetical protein